MLGDLPASLTDETTTTETLLCVGDLKLLTAAAERAAAAGIELAAFVIQVTRRYADEAADEEWITLMGLLNRSPNPGINSLPRACAYAL